MDILHLKIAENCLRKMEQDIDPFYNKKPTFVEVDTYRNSLENKCGLMYHNLEFLNFDNNVDFIKETISSLDECIEKSRYLPKYLSVDEKENSILVKSYYDDIMVSFNEYMKDNYPFSYKEIDLNKLTLNSTEDIKLFLESETINAVLIDDILIRKNKINNDLKELIVESNGIEIRETKQSLYTSDLYKLIGEITLIKKGIK